jgi:hypothetical protein
MNQILNKNLKTFLHELVENNNSNNNMVKPNSSDNQLNNLESLLNFFGINNINNKNVSPKANTKNGFVFSQGESGQWYNWANCFFCLELLKLVSFGLFLFPTNDLFWFSEESNE